MRPILLKVTKDWRPLVTGFNQDKFEKTCIKNRKKRKAKKKSRKK